MSNRLTPRRLRRAAVAVAALLAVGILPATAAAAPVNLATASPFVVLGGSGVTNTGPSVLNGELGVTPGTSLTGFNEAVVNGATHNNDAVAEIAQSDLNTAFGVAGGQAISQDLTGQDLGGLSLTPGVYGYSSSALLTGQLTLNAQGNPNAQFVFVIGSTLTTESASSVNLINGASPCNVFWRVGSSATLGTTTAFQGNLMALTDITVTNGVHVIGRALAREGQITLDTDTFVLPQCSTSGPTETTTTTETTTPTSTTPTPTPVAGTVAPAGTTTTTPKPGTPHKGNGTGKGSPPTSKGWSKVSHGPQGPNGTPVKVSGKMIAKIVVKVDNKTVESRKAPSLKMVVAASPGTHTVAIHVTYKDHTPAKTTKFQVHVPPPAPLHPHHGPSQFTG